MAGHAPALMDVHMIHYGQKYITYADINAAVAAIALWIGYQAAPRRQSNR